VRYVDAPDRVDAAATVLAELGERLDPEALASAAAEVPRTIAQRLGWLLDRAGHDDRTGPLHDALEGLPRDPVDLRPGLAAESPPDARWNVRIDRDVEVDE
jgi:hypothetical protein